MTLGSRRWGGDLTIMLLNGIIVSTSLASFTLVLLFPLAVYSPLVTNLVSHRLDLTGDIHSINSLTLPPASCQSHDQASL